MKIHPETTLGGNGDTFTVLRSTGDLCVTRLDHRGLYQPRARAVGEDDPFYAPCVLLVEANRADLAWGALNGLFTLDEVVEFVADHVIGKVAR